MPLVLREAAGVRQARQTRVNANWHTEEQREKLQMVAMQILWGDLWTAKGVEEQPAGKSIAFDLDVICALADGDAEMLAMVQSLYFRGVSLWAPGTALQELAATSTPVRAVDGTRIIPHRGLDGLLGWGLRPLELSAVENGVAARAATRLLDAGLLPAQEMNAALVIAEAAAGNIRYLQSADEGICEIDCARLCEVLDQCDLAPPTIIPRPKLTRQYVDNPSTRSR